MLFKMPLHTLILFLSLSLSQELTFTDPATGNRTNGTWTEVRPMEGLEAPDCVESEWSRDNHLGNTVGGYPITYNWTVPNLPHEHCVLRVRYVRQTDKQTDRQNYAH